MGLKRVIWIIIYLLILAGASLFLHGDWEEVLETTSRYQWKEVVQTIPEQLDRWTAMWREEAVVVSTAPDFGLPVYGEVIAGYGEQSHPLTKIPYFHRALDFAAEVGTPVLAVAPGRVDRVGYGVTLGHTLIIQHDAGWSSGYAHLSQVLVEEGEFVTTGMVVARSGTSGLLRLGTSPHLHFILYYQGSPVDPTSLLVDQGRRSLQ